jgi:anaerobic selenocysteine-containing dehydrogenase
VLFVLLSAWCFGVFWFGYIGVGADLPPGADVVSDTTRVSDTPTAPAGLRLVAYRPLFSGAAVERTPELEFQKPDAEIQLSRDDAKARGIRGGDTVTVSSNGTSVELRARVARDLHPGVVRVARDHAGDLPANVEVTLLRLHGAAQAAEAPASRAPERGPS